MIELSENRNQLYEKTRCECGHTTVVYQNGYGVCPNCGLVNEMNQWEEARINPSDSLTKKIIQSTNKNKYEKRPSKSQKSENQLRWLLNHPLNAFEKPISQKIYHLLQIFESKEEKIQIKYTIINNIEYYYHKIINAFPNLIHKKQWYVKLGKTFKGVTFSELIYFLFYQLYFKRQLNPMIKLTQDRLMVYLSIIHNNHRLLTRKRFMTIKCLLLSQRTKLVTDLLEIPSSNPSIVKVKKDFYIQLKNTIRYFINQINLNKLKNNKNRSSLIQFTNIREVMYKKVCDDIVNYPYAELSQRSMKAILGYLFWHNLHKYLKHQDICTLIGANGSTMILISSKLRKYIKN